jgi:2-keto-4-pentenoate hydratase
VAFGPFTTEPRPDAFTARVVVNGEVRGETTGTVDVEKTVRIARRLLPTVGEELRPGDRIIAGSILQVPVAPGDEVIVDLGPLGRVRADV